MLAIFTAHGSPLMFKLVRAKSFCFRVLSLFPLGLLHQLESFAMYGAFPRSDYYDSPALRVSHQSQLTQSFDRDTKFPRSQDALFQLDLGIRYIPVQGESPYVFGLPSFRSSRPQWKRMTHTLIARGVHTK